MKQVAHQKQMTGSDGIRIESRSKVPYQFSGTQLLKLPIPKGFLAGPLRQRLSVVSAEAISIADRMKSLSARKAIIQGLQPGQAIGSVWSGFLQERTGLRSRLIFLQEQIDFTVYSIVLDKWFEQAVKPRLRGRAFLVRYADDFVMGFQRKDDAERVYQVLPLRPPGRSTVGLADATVLGGEPDNASFQLNAGQRPFEILVGANEDEFPVPSDIPAAWPEVIQTLWSRRMEAIRDSRDLRLIENSHYKRRWIGRQRLFNQAAKADELKTALRDWLLNQLENTRYWPRPELVCIPPCSTTS
jgi:uncharacterized protein DUF7008